jgi:NADPH:quinone reductase-like Zn-dependent oxidoreductase
LAASGRGPYGLEIDFREDRRMAFDDRPGPTMTAVRIHGFGGPEAIRHDRVPSPAPGPGQVLVRVGAAGFNPSDTGFRGGLMQGVVPVKLPFTLGSEASGTVVQVGQGVTRLRVGDLVTGRTDGGATAEYLTADAALLVRVPAVLPLTHAAAVPVAGGTAWQALFEHARAEKGTRVLVNGAGEVRVDAEVRPFADLAQVHRDAEAGRISGKVVVSP